MRQKPSPIEADVRSRLLKAGVPDGALRAVLAHLEADFYFEPDKAVERAQQVAEAVAAGVRLYEVVLAIDREGRGDQSLIEGRALVRSGPSGSPVAFRRLAQRLMLTDLSRHPRVRAWRRKHLGGENERMSWDDADRWIMKNTEPLEEGAHVVLPTAIFWSIPGDVLKRNVPPTSPVASLLELTGFLGEETGWRWIDAAKWVLVGAAPPISEISIRTRLRHYDLWPTVILEASVWASDRFVTRQFRAARSVWMSRRPAPKQKVVEMANFRLDNLGLSWRDCWEQWNQGHPEEQYSSPATMKRSYYGLIETLKRLRKMKPGRKKGAKS